jgi:hypothetical protein
MRLVRWWDGRSAQGGACGDEEVAAGGGVLLRRPLPGGLPRRGPASGGALGMPLLAMGVLPEGGSAAGVLLLEGADGLLDDVVLLGGGCGGRVLARGGGATS